MVFLQNHVNSPLLIILPCLHCTLQQLDGISIKDLNLQHLRSQISIVSQEPILFARSIRDNIVYGLRREKTEVAQKEVEEAARGANIHNFITNLPLVNTFSLCRFLFVCLFVLVDGGIFCM